MWAVFSAMFISLHFLSETVPPVLVLLVNAIFKSYEQSLTDTSIKAGDRQLVSDHTTKIKTNDIIRQGATNYIVVDVDVSAPTSDVLNYISQVRVQ